MIDRLEAIALSEYTPAQLSNSKLLFHHTKNEKIDKFRKQMIDQLHKSKDIQIAEKYANDFLDTFIKKKIYRVNYYIDKQIVIDHDKNGILRLEGSSLSAKELKHIYSKLKFYVNRALKEAYIQQYWFSLNDCVLARYI